MGLQKKLEQLIASLLFLSVFVECVPTVFIDGHSPGIQFFGNPLKVLKQPGALGETHQNSTHHLEVGEPYASTWEVARQGTAVSHVVPYLAPIPHQEQVQDTAVGEQYPGVQSSDVEVSSSMPKTVNVKCHENLMEVVVDADLYSSGTLIDGADLRLGVDTRSGNNCYAIASGEAEFTILAKLSDCGTKMLSTADAFVYTNSLVYSPLPSSDGLFRREGVVVPVQCMYRRRFSVSSDLQPTWVPFTATRVVEDVLDFSLRLMSDDWLTPRSSYTFHLGEAMHFEAAVLANHIPLQVFVDHCVATLVPDWQSSPQYSFIENGCLTDAKYTGSYSHFLPRSQDDKLQFLLEAFTFQQQNSPSLFITCLLKAVPSTYTDSASKACTFFGGRWKSAGGDDWVCDSCDSMPSLSFSKTPAGIWKRATAEKGDLMAWHKAKTLGPVAVLPPLAQAVAPHS